jgi:hypothetical protein
MEAAKRGGDGDARLDVSVDARSEAVRAVTLLALEALDDFFRLRPPESRPTMLNGCV